MNVRPPNEQWSGGPRQGSWTDKSTDGLWTYVVPGTSRGGILVIKSGTVTGGNGLLYFRGVVLPLGDDRISMTTQAIRFNHDSRLDESWAATEDFYVVTFEGRRQGEDVVGTVTRHDTNQCFEVILSRRGPVTG